LNNLRNLLFFFKRNYNNNSESDFILSSNKNHNRILWEFTLKITSELIEYFSKINTKFNEFNFILMEKEIEVEIEIEKEKEDLNKDEDKGLRNNLNPRKDACN
jgi:hypothetical protein